MKVSFINLDRQHKPIKQELMQAFERILDSSQFILGEEVRTCENEIASFIGTDYAIGVSNGTNALMLSLKAVDVNPGDEVITSAFTFFATVEVISMIGATPVLCDIDPKTFNVDPERISQKITKRSKAIIPVHLYGQAAAMNEIMLIAQKHNVKVIEDMAQAIGAEHKGKKIGNFGNTACISFYPTKNLSALGDGGMVVTSDRRLGDKIRGMRNHGDVGKYLHEFLGHNERLDAIQAAFLRIKLKYLDDWNMRRSIIAQKYSERLKDIVQVPYIHTDNNSVFHQYTIRTAKRDELGQYLNENGIGTAIHYPTPLHLQPALKYLGYKIGDFPEAEKAAKEVLCLPIDPTLTDQEVSYVIETIRRFFRK